jgi:hypothetical protein
MDDVETHQPPLPAAVQLPDVGLLFDLGEQRRKAVRKLKYGRGKLARQIREAVDAARAELGIAAEERIVPVVLLYRCPSPAHTVTCVPRAAARSDDATP